MRNLGRPASGIILESDRQTHCAAVNKERANLYPTARQSCSGTCCSSAIGLLPRQSRQASLIPRHSLVVQSCQSIRRASNWLSSEKLPVQSVTALFYSRGGFKGIVRALISFCFLEGGIKLVNPKRHWSRGRKRRRFGEVLRLPSLRFTVYFILSVNEFAASRERCNVKSRICTISTLTLKRKTREHVSFLFTSLVISWEWINTFKVRHALSCIMSVSPYSVPCAWSCFSGL